MNLKADQDLLEKFKQNVENKVLNNLNSKLDKIEHKRIQNSLRKKMDSLEEKLIGKRNATTNSSFIDGKGPLLSKANNACMSCNRDLNDSKPNLMSNIPISSGFKNNSA